MTTASEEVVARWLLNDPALRDEAIRTATGDEFEWGDTNLAVWVIDLLYDVAYDAMVLGLRGSKPDLHWVSDLGGDPKAARRVRGEVSQDALFACDWAAVRAHLVGPEAGA